MNKKTLKSLLTAGVLFLIVMPAVMLALPVQAQPDLGMNYAMNLDLADSNQDPRDAAVNIVKYLMTFLGIIAVVVILYGGFIWMTAGGNEDKVASAKKIIIAGAIGLIIVLAAFFIIRFVLDATTDLLSNGTVG